MLLGGEALAHGARHHQHSHTSSHGRVASHTALRGGRHIHGVSFRYAYHHGHHGARYAYASYAHVIQCVAFAKEDAGIQISGNARDWWARAAGIYERGYEPESGSVLSFRANGRMPLGHVAVVSGIEDSRTILIDQSHWASRGITRDIEVKDVSQNNDWSAVRVQLRHGGAFGSIYPTHGFIYPRPDRGTMVTSDQTAPTPAYTRQVQAVQATHASLEVAELPATRGQPLDLSVGLNFDAPSRALR